ncbi:hypothetical protein [Gryllotalpicola ginsengisoli]|uniref:hypothetical protein n=1 Tax=Gryllotalpicola ginsengisoli TaxID=444608 RepID=UPI0003B78C85|nr:hypothetical protein [Gryllotalpicola ginsengisoli]
MTTTESRPRLLGPLALVGIVVAVLASAVAVTLGIGTIPTLAAISSPELPVRHYLQAVVDGDVSTAMKLGRITAGDDDVLLTDAAYRKATDRVSSFQILGVERSGATATVQARIRQGQAAYTAQFKVARASAPIVSAWRLAKQSLPTLTVNLHGPDDMTVKIGGHAVTAHDGQVVERAFPGTYAIDAAQEKYYSVSAGAVAAVFPPQQAAAAEVSAEAQPAAVSAAKDAVGKWLADCVAQTSMTPEGCPFYAEPQQGVTYSNGHWTLDEAPQVALGGWNDELGGWPVATSSPGYVTYSSDASVGGLTGTATTGSQPFEVSGTLVVSGDSVRFVPSSAYSDGGGTQIGDSDA